MTYIFNRSEPFLSNAQFSQTRDLSRIQVKLGPERQPAVTDAAAAMAERIKELELENRRLQRLTITDELTCAYNRRHFRASYLSLLNSTSRYPSIALCLFDIDHFKGYNDTFGHPMGDAALRAITRAIRPLLRRNSDCLFRFGGDEFGALFCASSAQGAMSMIQKFQQAVKSLRLSLTTDSTATLTATYGIAWHPNPGMANIDAKQFYSAADNTLYKAKHGGRNCILMRVMNDDEHDGESHLTKHATDPL